MSVYKITSLIAIGKYTSLKKIAYIANIVFLVKLYILLFNSEKAKMKEREETWQKIENLAQKNPKVSNSFYLF